MQEHVEIYPAAAGWLNVSHAANFRSSQFGEDGLVRRALDQIGIANRWCFEVGANDGEFYSNTLWLREAGWNAILIEAEQEHYDKLVRFRNDKVTCRKERITRRGPASLDAILREHGAPPDLDFGVIDIDGQDYWAWEGMEAFSPRLMLVEFDLGDSEIPPEGAGPDKQGGRKVIAELGQQKGYTPLAKTHVNLLFARNDVL